MGRKGQFIFAFCEGIVFFVVLMSVILTLSALGPDHTPHVKLQLPPTSTTTCTEDMSCWDCLTMGNLICEREQP